MKTFLELAEKRQSDRAYHDKAIEVEKLDRIIESARLAPSACNAQPWKMIIVDEPELKNKIADCTSSKVLGMNHFTKQAPVHIVLVQEQANFSSTIGSWIKQNHYRQTDLGILAEHICLAAADEDLGTCMIGWFNEKKVKSLLDIPRTKKVVLIITLGYPSAEHRSKKRKTTIEVVSKNSYRSPI